MRDLISAPLQGTGSSASLATIGLNGLHGTNMSDSSPVRGNNVETGNGGKKSRLRKLLHKGDKHGNDGLKSMPGSRGSLVESPARGSNASRIELPKPGLRHASVATFDSGTTIRPMEANPPEQGRKDSKVRAGLFTTPSKRNVNQLNLKSDERGRNGSAESGTRFELDEDLSNMEGIISQAVPPTPPYGGIFGASPIEEESTTDIADVANTGDAETWNAPDSWAVNRGEENVTRLPEIDETGIPPKADDHGAYCVRVFRVDSTFATLSTNLNVTVHEILQILGKKSFLQDELNNYQIVMRKHDLQRQLATSERPIAIQRRLLEQAGYHDSDRIEEIGREDNSYLCRFTFVPTKLSGYYGVDKNHGFDQMHRFSHVDLSSKSLITIPIILYKRAVEVISLNLSRNLSIDVPKDFIQSCCNLREIKFVSNEAWHLPQSFSLASRLTMLDVSNNRLENLDPADLDKLKSLIVLKLSNNKIRSLPKSFSRFVSLRSLNLSSNYITNFPECLYDLKCITDLDISFNSIKEFPKLGQLKTLEKIWVTNNELTGALPASFEMLENLREADFRFNAISNIDVLSKLPRLEQLMIGHNNISVLEGCLEKCKILHADHNPITRFNLTSAMPLLYSLNLASAKVAQLDDSLFEKMPNLVYFRIDKNHFVNMSPQIGKLRKLEYLSVAKNPLNSIPATVGNLIELRTLDARECNMKTLPPEIWCCVHLETLNVSSNLLDAFPKPNAVLQPPNPDSQPNPSTPTVHQPSSPHTEDLSKIEDFGHRRPSQASGGLLSVGSSPGGSTRKGSIVSVYGPGGRKASVISRTPTETNLSAIARKDSSMSTKLAGTFAGSLRNLYLADNRLTDEVFEEIGNISNLHTLNLSYNQLYDISPPILRRWPHLTELYLSGNELTSLPSDDLEGITSLRVLHINGNKFQNLPAELGKIHKLCVLDIGSNFLKYNVSNWPYDWNWNWNRNLRYLNFSGNKRLEIKPNLALAANANRDDADLTSFTTLHHLRVLGLMDVTMTITKIPEESEDRRVRTSGSLAGSLPYGMADSLGREEHLSIIDMVVPRFRSHDTEILLGLFDGHSTSTGGSKVAKFLHENFSSRFTEELDRLKPTDTPCDALRRTFLCLNKDLATAAGQTIDEREHRIPKYAHRGSVTAHTLTPEDLNSGGVATVLYLDNMDLYVANVGDAEAMLMRSDGSFITITQKHLPADRGERERIREAGGYVSRHGKLNDVLEVSRAFGYTQMMPAVMACPSTKRFTLGEQDEIVLIASRELWDYVTPDVVIDVARSERADPMRGAQKLRDLAMAFGATKKIMVMMIRVSDLKRREYRRNNRGQTLSMGPSQMPDDQIFRGNRRRRGDVPDDSTLARLDQEVQPPTGELSLVFTDIKNSTVLWETYPIAMRSAIKTHNSVMRRQLRIIGGYEVKTEGDAFMVAFPTATSALLWCFSVQSYLLDASWPSEILSSIHGQEVLDADQNRIYRGLSVRMGIHWGSPVCEPDPVTRRMDYFGPIVNRASRISSVADGGQITVSSDFLIEIQRTLETYAESDRASSVGSEDTLTDDALGQAIRRELRSLSSQGFEVKDLGEKKLKGLENPEYIYLMFPHSLAGRLIASQQRAEAEAVSAHPASLQPGSQLQIETQNVWDLWAVSLRLEMLCSGLEDATTSTLKAPETALLERMQNRGGEVTDRFLVDFVEHQVSRIEVCGPILYSLFFLFPCISSSSSSLVGWA